MSLTRAKAPVPLRAPDAAAFAAPPPAAPPPRRANARAPGPSPSRSIPATRSQPTSTAPKLTMLLDQGFGGWRSQGAPRHDFQAPAKAQAKAIRSASYAVRAEARETPIVQWEGSDAVPP